MQRNAPRLEVQHIIDANKFVKEMKDLFAIHFKMFEGETRTVEIWCSSESAISRAPGRDYGQTAIVTGLEVQYGDGDQAFHLVDCRSGKRERVGNSSYGTEVSACREA